MRTRERQVVPRLTNMPRFRFMIPAVVCVHLLCACPGWCDKDAKQSQSSKRAYANPADRPDLCFMRMCSVATSMHSIEELYPYLSSRNKRLASRRSEHGGSDSFDFKHYKGIADRTLGVSSFEITGSMAKLLVDSKTSVYDMGTHTWESSHANAAEVTMVFENNYWKFDKYSSHGSYTRLSVPIPHPYGQ